MMDNWFAFYAALGIFSIAGIVSALFAHGVNQKVADLEYLANGKVTDHHHFIPFD